MNDKIAVKSYVDDLFRYLSIYESDYGKFETEAFLQTYNGIIAVFHALRQQRDQAIEVDQYFLDIVNQSPLTSSDLRQMVVQVLITFFEVEADIDGRSNKAFSYCRGLRPVKQDVPYFENNLLPLLFREGALNNNFRLNDFFLKELARFLNTYGKPLDMSISPETFSAMPEPMKFLELTRRRVQAGENLIDDRASLEFHLKRVESFSKIAQGSDLAEKYLKEWKYLSEASFWSKVKSALSIAAGRMKGIFSSSRYTRLVTSQRNPAYFFYGFIVVLFIVLSIVVPMQWSSYSQDRLEDMKQRSEQLKRGN